MPRQTPGINSSLKEAFTLIELLVVIAIIAILAVVVVLVLNPAQLLAQSRDANRVSDISTLNSALSLYQTDQSGAQGYSLGTSSLVYMSYPDASSTCGDLGLQSLPGAYSWGCSSNSNYRLTNNTGWIPVNFSAISSGAPFGSLPVDPTNNTSSDLFYTYETSGSKYELTATMESQKYQNGGSGDVESTDGGQYANLYEKGTSLTLAPMNFAGSRVNFSVTQSANLAGTSRSLGTIYQNTTGNPIFIIAVSYPSGGNGTTWILTDSNSTPSNNVFSIFASGPGYARNPSAFVAPGNYYEVNYNTASTLTSWYEWNFSGATVTQSANLAGSSRSLNTVYRNTTGNPIFVAVNGNGGTTSALTDSNSSPSATVGVLNNSSGYGSTILFPVSAGNYYEVSNSGGTSLSTWYEWQISGFQLTQSADLAGSSRALKTVYQNTSSKPIFVSVVDVPGGTGSSWALTGTSSPPTNVVTELSAEPDRTNFFIVLPGSYYEVSYDTGTTLLHWYEWSVN